MRKIKSVKITNANVYFLHRALVFSAIRSNFIKLIVRGLYGNKKNLDINDVEQIFYIMDCEREAENIFFIRHMVSIYSIKNLLDIGCNFGQFVDSLSDSFVDCVCVDANPNAAHYTACHSRSNVTVVNKAVMPDDQAGECITLHVPLGNTGRASVNPVSELNYEEFIVQATSMKSLISEKAAIPRFIKIDVEGLEAALIEDYFKTNHNADILAFEILNTDARLKISKIFEERYDYNFFTIRYSFSSKSGLMTDNVAKLFSAILFNDASLDFYIAENLSDLNFEFMSLVYAVPKKYSVEYLFETLPINISF
jgi:FkbM family methyltransferase